MNVQVLVATAARLLLNTAQRMPYPYLPAFSRGLGVPIPRLIELLSIRSALAMGAPLLATLPDRYGRRHMMYLALVVFSGAMALVVVWPGLIALAAGSVLGLAAKTLFDTSLQSYIGDRVPYERRGRVLAFIELSWSGAFFLGLPVVGWLLVNAGTPADAWRAPFGPLALLGVLAAAVLWMVMPHDPPQAHPSERVAGPGWGTVLLNPRVLGGLAVGTLISGANENLSVVFGTWLEGSFALALTAIGLATAVIGVAELLGEGGVMVFSDRLGKRLAATWGLAASIGAYSLLPVLGRTLPGALSALFLVYLAFEFTLVTLIPLMTETMPRARARVMSAFLASHAVGRMLGALVGGRLLAAGILSTGLVSAAMNVAALGILLVWVRKEGDPH
jgi:predicted MFS family arabinose efflux permease